MSKKRAREDDSDSEQGHQQNEDSETLVALQSNEAGAQTDENKKRKRKRKSKNKAAIGAESSAASAGASSEPAAPTTSDFVEPDPVLAEVAARRAAKKQAKAEAGAAASGQVMEELAMADDSGRDRNAASSLTTHRFDELELSQPTRDALAAMGFEHMMEVQWRCIPLLLDGRDVLGAARTGSGKTLAYMLPIVELLYKVRMTPRNGTGAIVLTPVRELALQVFGVSQELMRGHSQTLALVIGGANRRNEADKLIKGANVIIATPGRLLDHLQNTPGFVHRNLQALVLDEADRMLEIGFAEDLRQILRILPSERQTLLFSATLNKNVEELAKLSLKNPMWVSVDATMPVSTAAGLEQGYVEVEADQRFLLLFTFLKKNRKNKKIIVFMSSCNAVKFYAELLNYIDIPCVDLHGRQKQVKRTSTFNAFIAAESGILIATDVAARGLDIPEVDWIIQYDPPDEPTEYIHRVGRTARAGRAGRALLFLQPHELGFLRYLKKSRVPISAYEFPKAKIANVQTQLLALIESNYYLNRSARDAFRSAVQAYASHSLKDIFDVQQLDLFKLAQSFGFAQPPKVALNINISRTEVRAERRGPASQSSAGWKRNPNNPHKRSKLDASLEEQDALREYAMPSQPSAASAYGAASAKMKHPHARQQMY